MKEKELIDAPAKEIIEGILRDGKDVIIRRKKDGIVILEEKRKIRYDACSIGNR